MLQARGFDLTEDLSRAEIADRYYGDLKQGDLTGPGPHMVRARSR